MYFLQFWDCNSVFKISLRKSDLGMIHSWWHLVPGSYLLLYRSHKARADHTDSKRNSRSFYPFSHIDGDFYKHSCSWNPTWRKSYLRVMSVLMHHLAFLPQKVIFFLCLFITLTRMCCVACVSTSSLAHQCKIGIAPFYLMHSHNSVRAVDFVFSVATHAVSKSLLTPHPQLFQR